MDGGDCVGRGWGGELCWKGAREGGWCVTAKVSKMELYLPGSSLAHYYNRSHLPAQLQIVKNDFFPFENPPNWPLQLCEFVLFSLESRLSCFWVKMAAVYKHKTVTIFINFLFVSTRAATGF